MDLADYITKDFPLQVAAGARGDADIYLDLKA